jgi:hypothetical protein
MREQLLSCSPTDLSLDVCANFLTRSTPRWKSRSKDLYARGGKQLIGLLLLAASMFTLLACAECASRLQMKRSSKAGERGVIHGFGSLSCATDCTGKHSLPCFGATRPHKGPT